MSSRDESDRTRTYTWDDPIETARKFATSSGMEVLHAIIDGTGPQPPIAQTMNFELVEVSGARGLRNDARRISLQSHRRRPRRRGRDVARFGDGLRCQCVVARWNRLHHTGNQGNLLRPLTMTTGPVRAEGAVVHLGRRMAVAEGRHRRRRQALRHRQHHLSGDDTRRVGTTLACIDSRIESVFFGDTQATKQHQSATTPQALPPLSYRVICPKTTRRTRTWTISGSISRSALFPACTSRRSSSPRWSPR